MRMLVSLLVALLHSLLALFRSREKQAIVEMAVCSQIPPTTSVALSGGLRHRYEWQEAA